MLKLRLLGISGSLKQNSNNSALLSILQQLKPEECEFEIYWGLENLPHFNPDKESGNEAVTSFKTALQNADGIIICTPEYAFGPPGVLKNALDWTVHTGDLNEKPLVLISSSPLPDGGNKALTSLSLTLQALGTNTPERWKLSIGNIKNKLQSGVLTDKDAMTKLSELYSDFVSSIKNTAGTN